MTTASKTDYVAMPEAVPIAASGGAPPVVDFDRSDIVHYDAVSRRVKCVYCGTSGVTKTRYETGLATHLAALGLCCIGCCPCALIPYCTDTGCGTKDVHHACGNCGQVVGKKKVI